MSGFQDVIIWLNAVLIILTFAALCSRVGRRIFVVGTFGWHDGLITLAATCSAIFSIFQMVCTKYGLGLHQADVPNPESTMPTLQRLLLVSNVFYFACNWAVKHALLLFYYDITVDRWHRISIYIMHFVAFGFGFSSILVNVFQCNPVRKAWEPNTPGTCVKIFHFFYFNSSFMLATDLVLYIMPVIFTRKLQLARMQRIGLNCLFALGGLVLAASAVRVWSVHMLATGDDFTRRFAEAMISSVIENHLAVIVACAPSMKVIALLVFPRLASSVNSIVSKVTRSSALSMRSRSRASQTLDLESGSRESYKLKPTPSSTPLPSPVYTGERDRSRASQNFAKWFKMPISPITGPGERDSMDKGLVLDERQPEDIRVEHTISIVRD